MSDSAIPITLVENTELFRWPLDWNVIPNTRKNVLEPYLDEVPINSLIGGSRDEPLFRLKLTRLVQSGEWVMGVSWSHAFGDAFACLRFLNTISRLYQQLEPLEPKPVFERRLWQEEKVDHFLLPIAEHVYESGPFEEVLKKYETDKKTYNQVNLCFTCKQLTKLRSLIDDNDVTIQDALSAYIILTLNVHCFENDDDIIMRTKNIFNFRGVNNSIAPSGLIANAFCPILSNKFDNPRSLSNIATTIRRSISRPRDATFLEPWLTALDEILRTMARGNRLLTLGFIQNEIRINSNLRYDWADLVDFGHTDKCRFHTTLSSAELYLRIFRLNPIYDGTQWMTRDRDAAEVCFLIKNEMKNKFMKAWQKDVSENFANVKT